MGNYRNSNTYNFLPLITSSVLAISLSSCTTLTTNKYEATARTIYTWQVEYYPVSTKNPRIENFASTFIINRDGVKPINAVTGPDDQGLWWPALPPRPGIHEIENRLQPQEKAGFPKLNKSVDYQFTYTIDDVDTLPSSYAVTGDSCFTEERFLIQVPTSLTSSPQA